MWDDGRVYLIHGHRPPARGDGVQLVELRPVRGPRGVRRWEVETPAEDLVVELPDLPTALQVASDLQHRICVLN